MPRSIRPCLPLALFLVALLLLAGAAPAQTFYVDATFGDDAASGLSWPEAFATVQKGLEAAKAAASSGGHPQVNVAEGNYAVAYALVDFPVVLLGGYPAGGGARDPAAHETILDAGGEYTAVSFGSVGRSVMDGFHVTGAADAAVIVHSDVTVRNCTVTDNKFGIIAQAGRIERNRVLRNRVYGIGASPLTSPSLWDCSKPILVSENYVAENLGIGMMVVDCCPLGGFPTMLVVENNRIHSTRASTGDDAGLVVGCSPVIFNNEVVGTEGAGVGFYPSSPPGPPFPPIHVDHLTVSGNTGPAIRIHDGYPGLVLSHSVLWGNAGGDIENATATLDVSYTLSESAIPGTGNISGIDPLLVPGADGSLRLSQLAAGQGADSVAVDAGARTAEEAGLANRTTRTDDVRDAGTVDLGFHAPPATFTLFRGTVASVLPPYMPGIVLPVTDPGAVGPPSPPVLFYRMDSDDLIFLARSGADVEIRFDY